MTNTSTHTPHPHPPRRQWLSWLVLAVAIAGLAFVIGALVGLAPGHTALIVAGTLLVALALTIWRQRSSADDDHIGLGTLLPLFLIAGCATFVAIQMVPYGREHANPAPTGEPAWSSPRTRDLMISACYGCHSNEVDSPTATTRPRATTENPTTIATTMTDT